MAYWYQQDDPPPWTDPVLCALKFWGVDVIFSEFASDLAATWVPSDPSLAAERASKLNALGIHKEFLKTNNEPDDSRTWNDDGIKDLLRLLEVGSGGWFSQPERVALAQMFVDHCKNKCQEASNLLEDLATRTGDEVPVDLGDPNSAPSA